MGFIKALLASRKFWLTVGACISAVLAGHVEWLPGIIMAEVGAITIEDAAHKLGLKWQAPPAQD